MSTQRLPSPTMSTEFPAGILSHNSSSHTTETFGAFDEMDLTKQQQRPQQFIAPVQMSRHPPPVPPPTYAIPQRPHPSTESSESMVRFHNVQHVNGVPRRTYDEEIPVEAIYKPTTIRSDAGSDYRNRQQSGKLLDVYSMSGDTVEFAHNFGNFMNANVSPFIWISLFSVLCLYGLVMLFVGAGIFWHNFRLKRIFNVPYCSVQPMIPVWMVVMGLLSIAASCLRIYYMWPTPASLARRRTSKNLSGTLMTRAIEMILLVTIIVWLILGAVWVYGSRPYVHFSEGSFMFEHHFCDWGLYWIAFWSVTVLLVLIAVVIVAIIVLLSIGACKEAELEEELPR